MAIEALVSACAGGTSDRKIACETLAGKDKPSEKMDHMEPHPDSPPESFWLSKDAEFDWFDRNAFMERKESTKGNFNSSNLNHSCNSSTSSSSQRYSRNLKLKTKIIGLPKPHNPCFIDAKNRKPETTRFFPKRSRSGGKSDTGSMTEPSSPKVSCIGRVRSKKGRRLRNHQESETQEKPRKKEQRKTGFFKIFLANFMCSCKNKSASKSDQPLHVDSHPRKSEARRARDGTLSELEPPGLGGMKRFVSGRRSELCVGDVAVHA